MADVLDRFKHLFSSKPDPSPSAPMITDEELEIRKAHVQDMRVFIGTKAYKDFRSEVQTAIEANRPDPKLGMEAVACATMMQEGLRLSLRILDAMIQIAQERNDAD